MKETRKRAIKKKKKKKKSKRMTPDSKGKRMGEARQIQWTSLSMTQRTRKKEAARKGNREDRENSSRTQARYLSEY